jgi:hypothetical protein
MDMGIFGARFFSLSSLTKNPGPARQQNTVIPMSFGMEIIAIIN